MGKSDTRSMVEEFLGALLGAVQMRSVYGKDHNLAISAVDKLYARLSAAMPGRSEITIGIIGDELVFEGKPFYEKSKNMGKLILRLKSGKIGKVSFLKSIEKRELAAFVNTLVANVKPSEKGHEVKSSLEACMVRNILISDIGLGEEPDSAESARTSGEAPAGSGFSDGISFLKRTLDDMANNKAVDMKAAHFVVTKIIKNLLNNISSLLILTSLKKHDEYTFVHSLNVAILTLVQAEALGLPEWALADIGVAALLHDVGKLSIEAEIVRKEGRLSREELEKIRSHPIDGAEILLETPGVPVLAAISAFEHHLKYNMQGYPARLYGDKLNLASMMITVADAYDAMRSKWSSRGEFVSEKVYEGMMELSGETFHPDLLEIFFSKIGLYPPGTLVELDDRSIGLVVKENVADMKRPQVEMLYNSAGAKEKESRIVSLADKDAATGKYKNTIVKSISFSDKYTIPPKYMIE